MVTGPRRVVERVLPESATMSAMTELTGRYLLVMSDDLLGDDEGAMAAISEVSGMVDVTCTGAVEDSALTAEQLRGGGGLLFSELGIAIVTMAEGRLTTEGGLRTADARILAVEPERTLYALRHRLTGEGLVDDDTATWGLRATGVLEAGETGAGVTIAVLDTGLDTGHPDFADREVETRSFVAGEDVQDGQGHGTHVAGTAAGVAQPAQGRRYGVAPGARLMVGKVLSNAGSGTDSDILAGMSWAINAGAQVISMSLGADAREVSTAYETVGRRALAAGALVVAAAGNNADRAAGNPGFVGIPANSPSIMAVAAVDSGLAIAGFSAQATDVAGGEINIAAPGVDVYSSWPMPKGNNTISGTSMATPHVAGLAALWAERTGAKGQELWDAVVNGAQDLQLPPADVGAGLASAPTP